MKFISIVFFICMVTVSYLLVLAIEKEHDIYKQQLGKHIVLNDSSYTIIDYSLINETYTLDNGTEISKELYNLNNNSK